jgi:hypothetical protein
MSSDENTADPGRASFVIMSAIETFDGQERLMSRAAYELQVRATSHSAAAHLLLLMEYTPLMQNRPFRGLRSSDARSLVTGLHGRVEPGVAGMRVGHRCACVVPQVAGELWTWPFRASSAAEAVPSENRPVFEGSARRRCKRFRGA